MALLVSLALLIVLASVKVRLDFSGDYEGFFILEGRQGAWLELTDDLFPEDSERLLWGMPLTSLKRVVGTSTCNASESPCLIYEWNEATGRGFIKCLYPDGRKFLVCLGRFKDSSNRQNSGIFLGGGLPPSDIDYHAFDKNETGMSYFDGRRYYHIWCNVNEALFDLASNTPVYPAQWQFLSSRVVETSPEELTLVSNHQATLGGVPIRMQRFLHYTAGDSYVTLVTHLTNVGSRSVTFNYAYGDEPWVGNFGSSAGNVGWVRDRLIQTEGYIDTSQTTFAGMFDYGNELAGEKHYYTNMANFIEWQQSNPPGIVYFANQFGSVASPQRQVPLASVDNRVISLQWGPRQLQPGDSFSFTIAVGMASKNPLTGFPIKPVTAIN